ADCLRAEGYGRTDPRSCVFYARRVVEQLVVFIHDVKRLPEPYLTELAARIADPAFRQVAGPQIAAKADLIRRVGNVGVHENKPITENTAINVLRELHHVVLWAAFNFSTDPDSVPTRSAFDPSLVPAPAQAGSQPPLSQDELTALLQRFEAKDAAIAEEKATNAELQAELDQLRAQ